MSPQSIVIVGTGVFGVSTALSYKARHPSSTVTLISHDSTPIPASYDTAKIVRRVYSVPAYASLASSAMALWVGDAYKSVYHNSGWYVFHKSTPAILADGSRVVSEEEVRGIHGGILSHARMDDVQEVQADEKTAWVEASRAVEGEMERAKGLGVKIVDGEAVGLLWEKEGRSCGGVRMKDGRELEGSVVLAMGCWTPGFLERMGLNGNMGSGRWVGVSVLGVKISEEMYERYKGMPVLAVRGEGEIMPPDEDRIIKINNSRSFIVTDPTILEKEPDEKSPFFDENMDLLLRLLPELKDVNIAFRRYCCDCLTKTQDFVISAVEEREQLYVAYGGSFHGWKFLPNIGDNVIDMVEGKLEASWKERWSGKFESEDRIHESVIPKRVLEGF